MTCAHLPNAFGDGIPKELWFLGDLGRKVVVSVDKRPRYDTAVADFYEDPLTANEFWAFCRRILRESRWLVVDTVWSCIDKPPFCVHKVTLIKPNA